MDDKLRRDDFAPRLPEKPKEVLRTRWCLMRGDGSGYATTRIYTAVQAKRYVKLAARFGVDVYAARFGKVWVRER